MAFIDVALERSGRDRGLSFEWYPEEVLLGKVRWVGVTGAVTLRSLTVILSVRLVPLPRRDCPPHPSECLEPPRLVATEVAPLGDT